MVKARLMHARHEWYGLVPQEARVVIALTIRAGSPLSSAVSASLTQTSSMKDYSLLQKMDAATKATFQ